VLHGQDGAGFPKELGQRGDEGQPQQAVDVLGVGARHAVPVDVAIVAGVSALALLHFRRLS